jgi:hypothetical protein
MMLAMHRDPLLRAETGRNPQTEPEDECDHPMQFESFMRGAAVKKNRRTEDGGLRNERRSEQAQTQLPEHATA